MKRTLFTLSALVLLALPAQLTFAQETAEQPQTGTSDQSTLQDRIQERKEKLKLTLDTAKSKRLKLRCKASQGKLKSATKRINGIRISRSEVYNNLTARLNIAKDKLTEAQSDTTKLTEAMSELADEVVTYKTVMTSYQSAVDDASALDCEADPEAFWVSLSEARNLLSDIDKSHSQIKNILTDKIKPELVELKKQLGADNDPNSGEEQ